MLFEQDNSKRIPFEVFDDNGFFGSPVVDLDLELMMEGARAPFSWYNAVSKSYTYDRALAELLSKITESNPVELSKTTESRPSLVVERGKAIDTSPDVVSSSQTVHSSGVASSSRSAASSHNASTSNAEDDVSD